MHGKSRIFIFLFHSKKQMTGFHKTTSSVKCQLLILSQHSCICISGNLNENLTLLYLTKLYVLLILLCNFIASSIVTYSRLLRLTIKTFLPLHKYTVKQKLLNITSQSLNNKFCLIAVLITKLKLKI